MKGRVGVLTGIAVFVAIIFIAIAVVFGGSDVKAVAEEIEIGYTVTINQSGQTYSYDDGVSDSQDFADLDSLIDEVVGLVDGSYACARFNNINTADSVSVSDGKIVFCGEVSCSSSDAFITVDDGGEVVLRDCKVVASSTAVHVSSGGKIRVQDSEISISESVSTEYSVIVNRGTAVFDGAKVVNRAKYGTKSIGNAVLQNQDTAYLNVVSGEFSGASAVFINSGTAVIDGGEFSAVGTADEWSSSGFALFVSDNGKVTVNGGTYNSNDEERTITYGGDSNGSFLWKGGTIVGKIVVGAENKGKLTVIDEGTPSKTYVVLPSSYGNIYLYADGDLTVDGARLGFASKNGSGYYAVKWTSGQYSTQDSSPLLSGFYSDEEIAVEVSDEYEITAYLGGIKGKSLTKRYGESVNAEDIDGLVDVKDGYVISSRKIGGEGMIFPYVIEKNIDVVVEITVAEPKLSQLGEVTFTYDGEDKEITAPLDEISGLSYQYSWEKEVNNAWQTVSYSGDNVMTVKEVAHSGKYRIICTVTDGKDTQTSQIEFTVVVNKGTYSDITHRELSGTYGATTYLSSYQLDTGYKWTNPFDVPTVSVKKYQATYCLDENNYQPYALEITINLEKANAVIKLHGELTGTYDKDATLKDYDLDTGWRWADESIIPTVKTTSYYAYYAPNENYEEYYASITLRLSKGNYAEISDLVINAKYRENLTPSNALSECENGYGYAFIDTLAQNTVLQSVGDSEYDAVYNADKDNYNDYYGVKIILKVDKGVKEKQYGTIDGGVYEIGKTLSRVSLEEFWRWENENELLTVNKTEYNVFYNPNPELYDDYATTVVVITQKAEVPESEKIHARLSGVYDQGKTLNDYALESGWTWNDASIVPTVNVLTYGASYVKDENHLVYNGVVELVLEKANYDLSGVVLADVVATYDGKEHSVECKNLPDGFTASYENNGKIYAGNYTVTVSFSQPDSVNYQQVADKYAYITINKASSGIVGELVQHFVYDGMDKFPVVAVNNDEQTLNTLDTPNKEIGEYTAKFYVEESSNYLSGEWTVVYYVKAEYVQSEPTSLEWWAILLITLASVSGLSIISLSAVIMIKIVKNEKVKKETQKAEKAEEKE